MTVLNFERVELMSIMQEIQLLKQRDKFLTKLENPGIIHIYFQFGDLQKKSIVKEFDYSRWRYIHLQHIYFQFSDLPKKSIVIEFDSCKWRYIYLHIHITYIQLCDLQKRILSTILNL